MGNQRVEKKQRSRVCTCRPYHPAGLCLAWLFVYANSITSVKFLFAFESRTARFRCNVDLKLFRAYLSVRREFGCK